MRGYYLDDPKESASSFVLYELGLDDFDSSKISGDYQEVSSTLKSYNLAIEHKITSSIVMKVTQGELMLYLRDSAGVWIAVPVMTNDTIILSKQAYRKIVPSFDCTYQLYSTTTDITYTQRFQEDIDSVETIKYHNYRELVCELCQQFFRSGWVTGTGGSISIKYGNRIYMTPSGVQKERIQPNELFVLDTAGNILSTPARTKSFLNVKLSDCSPLFLHAYKQRNAGAVLHSHSYCVNLITSIFEGKNEFRISHQEMIKGIRGYGYYDELVVPIIENTAHEHELADMLGETIAKYPKAYAVLVRRHGMYVWGNTWEEAKRHGECYHYLFDVVVQMRQLGLDYTRPPKTANANDVMNSVKHVVFDIEGTTTPITFVKDVLFPYAANNVQSYLKKTWGESTTQHDVTTLLSQYQQDQQESYPGLPVVTVTDDVDSMIAQLTTYVQFNITHDRKITALKQLQGHMWRVGYESGELKSSVYNDVPNAFRKIVSEGKQISIYSSGSREAQRLLFQYTNHGDLRSNIAVYFDTKIGNKRDVSSYVEMKEYLGVDNGKEILFVTDIWEEADAATKAGLQVRLSVRPGNAPLPADNQFVTVTNFEDILFSA